MSSPDSLEVLYPGIKWRVPQPVRWLESGVTRFACRICIANGGLKIDSPWQWDSDAEARDHIQRKHPKNQVTKKAPT